MNSHWTPHTSHSLLDGTVGSPHQVLPSGYWWSLLYATAIALLCLLVCLVGAHIYAKATFIIFLLVMFVLCTIFISFFAVRPRTIILPSSSTPNPNGTGPGFPTSANFTGFKLDTLLGNLGGKVEEAGPKTGLLSQIFFLLSYAHTRLGEPYDLWCVHLLCSFWQQ